MSGKETPPPIFQEEERKQRDTTGSCWIKSYIKSFNFPNTAFSVIFALISFHIRHLRAEQPSSLVSGHLHVATIVVICVLNRGHTVDGGFAIELDSLRRGAAPWRAGAGAGAGAILLEDAFRRGRVGICKRSLMLHGGETSLVELCVASSWAQRRRR